MIVVNARFLTQKLTGVQRFSIELSVRLKKVFKDEIMFVSPYGVVHKDIAKELDAEILGSHVGHLWEQLDLPKYLHSIGTPLLICFGNTAPVLYPNKISTLHDVTFLKYSNTYSWKFRLFYRILIPMVLRTSRKVLTVSGFSKEEIRSVYGLAGEKVTVIYNAVSSMFCLLKEKLTDEIYLLAVSSLKENKNFEMVISAYQTAKLSVHNLKLYIIGDLSESSFGANVNLIKKIETDSDIKLLGRISDAELVRYYNNALAFIFPSFYEGFGIPVLEAQACGCPVVASNSSSLPEVLADSALLCEPNDQRAFADAIIRLSVDKRLSSHLIEKGLKNLERFSWNKSAHDVMEVIKSMV